MRGARGRSNTRRRGSVEAVDLADTRFSRPNSLVLRSFVEDALRMDSVWSRKVSSLLLAVTKHQ